PGLKSRGMDTLTHGLAGALLARTLPSTGDETLDRTLARREAWVGFAAAMFPDADVFVSPFSAEFYITQHRALTHSFVALPVWIVLLTAVASIYPSPALGPSGAAGRRTAVRRLGVVVALALVSHILLDWITSWGTMFLSPISSARFTLDWTFILDAALSGLLVLGLVGVRAVSRRSFPRSRVAARAGLLAATAYVGLCAVRHAQAVRLGEALAPRASGRAAIPQPGSPDRWLLLSDDGPAVTATFVDLGKRGREITRPPEDDELARTGFRGGALNLLRHLDGVYRSRDDLAPRVIEKANGPLARLTLETGIAGVFGRFARFPAAREKLRGDAVEVLLRDVRFGYLSNEVDPFTYIVRYSREGRVLSSGFPSSRWSREAAPRSVGAAR
ncbi:MAG: metal-dependent hydrolase, partial [Thermoanaerobaculia bacterium]